MIKAKSYFLGHRTSMEQSRSDTNRVEAEERGKGKKYTHKSVKKPLVENQWGVVANLLELPPLKSSLLLYDNDVILLVSSSDLRAVEGKDLWAVWHGAFAFEETQMRSFGKSLQDPRWTPLGFNYTILSLVPLQCLSAASISLCMISVRL